LSITLFSFQTTWTFWTVLCRTILKPCLAQRHGATKVFIIIHQLHSFHFGHPFPSFWTPVLQNVFYCILPILSPGSCLLTSLFPHSGQSCAEPIKPFLALRHPAVAGLTRELASRKGNPFLNHKTHKRTQKDIY